MRLPAALRTILGDVTAVMFFMLAFAPLAELTKSVVRDLLASLAIFVLASERIEQNAGGRLQ